jgi:lipoprotein-releasing system permease protein
VVATAPFVNGQGILISRGYNHPSVITGVLPASEAKVSFIAQKMVAGSFDDLQPNKFGIVLGEQLAMNLGVWVGDKVTLLIPSATINPLGIMPRFKPFKVVGIFHVGTGFGFDTDMAFIHMRDAQALYQFGNGVSGIRLKLNDLYAAPKLSREIAQHLPNTYIVSNWTDDYGTLFHAVALEKTMMFLILLLLIAVAAFNLVSTLVMVVTDKQADIAILRTLGATPRTILLIFMVQGTVIGLVGTLIGLVGGVALALHVTRIVNAIEQIFHVQLMSSSVYYVNFLPSHLVWSDVWHISLVAFVMSLLATIYPAWRAARTQPAEALRYE